MTRRRGILAVLTALIVALGSTVAPAPAATAVSAGDFQAGNIISDEAFFNAGAMTQAQVQQFLASAVPNCVGAEGLPCLKDYRESTVSRAAVEPGHCGAYAGAPNELASTIIWRVAQACGINPQVLIVTLQKEQSLVTDPSPDARQYRVAMGYGCPDTADCDAQYYGFSNQVYRAAWQFRQYTNYPDRRYRIGAVSIQFHPNTACGSSVVDIRNQATANLYNYTPYQPNAAALANLGGVGDGCSAYGNRNFWVFFNNWFGSTQTSVGPQQIRDLYASTGGPNGPLGPPVSEILYISANGGGLGQAYVNGSIFWTGATGAYIVTEPVRAYYFAKGGAAGALAWPTSNVVGIPQNGGGVGQAFQGGSVYVSARTGTFSVRGPIRTQYWARNGAAGVLGWPLADQVAVAANGGGTLQEFEGGTVYSSRAHGDWVSAGVVRSRYLALGGPSGSLSWPSSPVVAITGYGSGSGQAYGNGSIYNSAAGTWEVTGAIRAHYFGRGGAVGQLGWPKAAPACSSATACSQSFQFGTITWTSADGARVIVPEIDAVHSAAGGSSGPLGRPVSDYLTITANGAGVARAYEGGSIYSSPAGAYAVTGGVRDFYFSQGGAAGGLGWPLGAQACSTDRTQCSQPFGGGVVYWSTTTGGRVGLPAIEEEYAALGGEAGVLGPRASGLIPIPQNGGGYGQAYANGSIYWTHSTGAVAVMGGVRAHYFRSGGAAGALAWPTADQQCGLPEGECSQAFQHGVIYATATAGRLGIPAIEAAYAALGGRNGILGARMSEPIAIPQNGGGHGQVFAGGSIYSSGAGAFAVTGGIRDFYFSRGGSAGSLGWPTGNATCDASGTSCTQSFQNGTIAWSAGSGGRLQ